MFQPLIDAGFDVTTRNHAAAILAGDFAAEARALTDTLLALGMTARDLIRSGGGQAKSTIRLRDALYGRGLAQAHLLDPGHG